MPCRSGWTHGCGSPNDLAWPFSQHNMTRCRWHGNAAWGMQAILSAELYHRGGDATMRLWAYNRCADRAERATSMCHPGFPQPSCATPSPHVAPGNPAPSCSAQPGRAAPRSAAGHELCSPWQHGGEHGSGCAFWTEKMPSMEYHWLCHGTWNLPMSFEPDGIRSPSVSKKMWLPRYSY
jgi:hypothetical protein